MKVGSSGVVISRTRLGWPSVRMKIRVSPTRAVFLGTAASDFVRSPKMPRAQGPHDSRTSRPPLSMVASISMIAAHLAPGAFSCKRLESCVFSLWQSIAELL